METIWTQDLVTQLSALWKQGLSTAEIGRRLNISKNAVVGKAHRLMLDPRPSPLKRPPGSQRRARRLRRPTLRLCCAFGCRPLRHDRRARDVAPWARP